MGNLPTAAGEQNQNIIVRDDILSFEYFVIFLSIYECCVEHPTTFDTAIIIICCIFVFIVLFMLLLLSHLVQLSVV